MGLWLWDEDPQFCMYRADRLTTLAAAAIAAGVLEPPVPVKPRPLPPGVVELAAYRVARLAEGGPDA